MMKKVVLTLTLAGSFACYASQEKQKALAPDEMQSQDRPNTPEQDVELLRLALTALDKQPVQQVSESLPHSPVGCMDSLTNSDEDFNDTFNGKLPEKKKKRKKQLPLDGFSLDLFQQELTLKKSSDTQSPSNSPITDSPEYIDFDNLSDDEEDQEAQEAVQDDTGVLEEVFIEKNEEKNKFHN